MKKTMGKTSEKVADRDNPEWTCEDFARAAPLSGLSKALQKVLEKCANERKSDLRS